jgi:hypothetical protein
VDREKQNWNGEWEWGSRIRNVGEERRINSRPITDLCRLLRWSSGVGFVGLESGTSGLEIACLESSDAGLEGVADDGWSDHCGWFVVCDVRCVCAGRCVCFRFCGPIEACRVKPNLLQEKGKALQK